MTTTVTATGSHGLQLPNAAQPLPLTVTDGGALVVQMQSLLRQITPVLEQPDSVPNSYRQQLAERVKALLEGAPEEILSREEEYEPGCWLDETEMEEPW
jgi:hypothetical protein